MRCLQALAAMPRSCHWLVAQITLVLRYGLEGRVRAMSRMQNLNFRLLPGARVEVASVGFRGPLTGAPRTIGRDPQWLRLDGFLAMLSATVGLKSAHWAR